MDLLSGRLAQDPVFLGPPKWRRTMAYQIECRLCRTDTWVGSITDLIDLHTDERGRLICAMCGATECYIHRITGLEEKEPNEEWDGYIKGIIRVPSKTTAYAPFVFLTAGSPDEEVTAIRFSYYRPSGPGGRIADGPGPGGAPVLDQVDLFHLLDRLSAFGIIKPRDVEVLGARFRWDFPGYSSVQSRLSAPDGRGHGPRQYLQ